MWVYATFSQLITGFKDLAFHNFNSGSVRDQIGLGIAAFHISNSNFTFLLSILNVYYTAEFSDDSKTLWLTCLKKLLNSRKTLCDIAAGNTTGMECTHGQLCTRLTDRLSCDDTNCFTNLYRLSGCHVCAVALSTHTNVGLTA